MAEYSDLLASTRRGTEPDDALLDAVADETRRKLRQPRRPAAPLVVTGIALAAVALFALRPTRVDRVLDDAGDVALGGDVAVVSAGSGSVAGTTRTMEVAWDQGRLDAEITPGAGVEFVVRTPEGTTRVVGTGLTVTRDAFGTTTEVRHGRVEVRCARGGTWLIGAGESRTCPPTDGPGALGRVLALDGRVTPATLLAEVDAARGLPGADGAVGAELAALGARALLDAGRVEDARRAAESALADPACTRPDELHRVVARIALRGGDCAAAVSHLEALEASGALGEDAEALDKCRAAP